MIATGTRHKKVYLMRKVLRLTSLVILASAVAACGKSEPAPEAATSAAPADAAATAAAPVAKLPAAGSYEWSSADGKAKGTTTINADGSYREVVNGGLPTAGIVSMVDGKTCFDPSGDKPAECSTDGEPAADGSFTSTAADGTVLNVKPVAK